jgi:hypothetical protein
MKLNIEKNGFTVALVLFLLIAIILCANFVSLEYQTGYIFEGLLAGNDGTDIVSLTFTGQGQKFAIRDFETLRYLNECFRAALKENNPNHHHIGRVYDLVVEIANGGSVRLHCMVPDAADGLTIGYSKALFDDPIYYWVKFPEPMLLTISPILTKLRRPPDLGGHVIPTVK